MEEKFKKFRKFMTSSGKMVLGGRDAGQNEELVLHFLGKQNVIMHTKEAGSPFCIIVNEKPDDKDLKEMACFCAYYSRYWKKNKKDTEVHIFNGKQVYKEKNMTA